MKLTSAISLVVLAISVTQGQTLEGHDKGRCTIKEQECKSSSPYKTWDPVKCSEANPCVEAGGDCYVNKEAGKLGLSKYAICGAKYDRHNDLSSLKEKAKNTSIKDYLLDQPLEVPKATGSGGGTGGKQRRFAFAA